ncbi:MAG: PorV/PorQ family protein [Methanococcaceae archaeon]
MKKIILFIIILQSTFVLGGDFKKVGTAGFAFLDIPVSARVNGLGEASVSLADLNSAAVFTNPGALGLTNLTHSMSVSYAPYLADIKNYATSYSYKSDFGVIGLGAVIMDYGTMPRTVRLDGQRLFEQIGEFKANSMSLGLSYSRKLTDKFSCGLTAKYVAEKIDSYTASNILMDGGIIYYTGFQSLRIGAAIQNIGTNSKFINEKFKMPSLLRIGASAEVYQTDENRVTLIAEAIHPTDADEKLNVACEIQLINMITLRGGLKFFYDEEKYTFGVGITPAAQASYPVTFDFSYANYGRLGNILRFTFQMGLL